MKVFLSHAWRDKHLAAFKAIERKIRDAGHEVWVDKRGIEYGQRITETLEAAIGEADVVLVLWSENAAQSEAVKHEIATALRLGRLLVPCRIGSVDPGSYGPLRDRKYLRFDFNLEFGLLQLSQFLIRLQCARNPVFGQHEELMGKVGALGEALVEVEDTVYRQEHRMSGNAASSAYVNAMVETGLRLVERSGDSPAEKARLLDFFRRVQEIARRHPDPADEGIRQQKLLEAIREADPQCESGTLQRFLQITQMAVGTRRPESVGRVGLSR